jgi:hypothetical protein
VSRLQARWQGSGTGGQMGSSLLVQMDGVRVGRVKRRRDGLERRLPLSDKKASCYLTAEAAARCLTIVPWRSQAFWGLDVFELGSLRLRLFAARRAQLA